MDLHIKTIDSIIQSNIFDKYVNIYLLVSNISIF